MSEQGKDRMIFGPGWQTVIMSFSYFRECPREDTCPGTTPTPGESVVLCEDCQHAKDRARVAERVNQWMEGMLTPSPEPEGHLASIDSTTGSSSNIADGMSGPTIQKFTSIPIASLLSGSAAERALMPPVRRGEVKSAREAPPPFASG